MDDVASVDKLFADALGVGADQEGLSATPTHFGLRSLSLRGSRLNDFAPVDLDDLEMLRASLGLTLEQRENAVLMDTTTLTVVDELVTGEGRQPLTPATLLDLATFATNVVLFDRIFHFEMPSLVDGRLNAGVGDSVLVPISVQRPPPALGPIGHPSVGSDAVVH